MSQNTKAFLYSYYVNGVRTPFLQVDAQEVFEDVMKFAKQTLTANYVEKMSITTQNHKTKFGDIKPVLQKPSKTKHFLLKNLGGDVHRFAEFLGIDYQRG